MKILMLINKSQWEITLHNSRAFDFVPTNKNDQIAKSYSTACLKLDAMFF